MNQGVSRYSPTDWLTDLPLKQWRRLKKWFVRASEEQIWYLTDSESGPFLKKKQKKNLEGHLHFILSTGWGLGGGPGCRLWNWPLHPWEDRTSGCALLHRRGHRGRRWRCECWHLLPCCKLVHAGTKPCRYYRSLTMFCSVTGKNMLFFLSCFSCA